MHRYRRFVLFVFALIASSASICANAHAILIDSSPKPDGTLPAGHVVLNLKYNSKIDQARSRLNLVGPDKKETVLPVAADTDKPNELASEAHLSPGAYVVHWQALALDGHITRGDLAFTVAPAP